MKRSTAVFFVAVLLRGSVFAEAGRTGGLTLTRGVAARPSALAEAVTALPAELDALTINPASLACVASPSISSTYLRGFAQDNFASASYAHPLPFGSVFIGGSYYDAGTIDINQSNGVHEMVRAQQDSVGMLGVAFGRRGPFSIGVTGKFLRSELAEASSASGASADGGVQWRTPLPGLALGAALQNVGPDLKFEQQGDPLPQTARLGVSYSLDLQKMGAVKFFPYKFLLLADGVKVRDESAGVRIGFEAARSFSLLDSDGNVALRGGYRSDEHVLDFGVGFLVANFSLDYSLRLISDLDPSHRFTLGYRFGEKRTAPTPRR